MSEGPVSIVPQGAVALARRGSRPGTPYFEDAPESLVRALERIDAGSVEVADVDTIVQTARPKDSLTLWHLLTRVAAELRPVVFARLAEIQPPPPGVSPEAVYSLDNRALDRWRAALEPRWVPETSPGYFKRQKVLRRYAGR